MIETHQWTGWWRAWPDIGHGAPEYGPCETEVRGKRCGRPRHEHANPAPARKLISPE